MTYGWKNFNRECPKCHKYIRRYAHRCDFCGVPIKNICGKVYLK